MFYAWPDFARKAEALADELRRRGFPVVVRSGTSRLRRLLVAASPDLWIGFWNDHPLVYMPREYVFFNAEPLGVPRWRDNEDWTAAMRGALQVWGYSRHNEPFVKQLGIPFRYVPFGYSPYYQIAFRRHTEGKSLRQDVDVLFFGSISPRRQLILDRIRDAGVNVLAVTRDNPLHGERLDEALARAKIILGVHSFDDPDTHIADFARLDHLLSNRRFVLHERLSNDAADPSFERAVVTCPYDEIPERCAYYLARPDDRERIADQAFQWFRAERSLDAFIPYTDVRRFLAGNDTMDDSGL